MMRLLLTVAMFSVAAVPEAWACSLPPGAATAAMPLNDTGVVSQPLLVATIPAPTLLDDQGKAVALEAFSATPFQDVRGAQGGTLFLFRPVAPLATGDYVFNSGMASRILWVDATVSPSPPAVGASGLLQFTRHTEDESGGVGCGGGPVVPTCGSTTRLVIDLPEANAGGPFLLTLTSPDAPARVMLLTEGTGRTPLELLLWGTWPLDFGSRRSCVTVAGVAEDGALGATLDLGCIDPTDANDPRVVNTEATMNEGAGCRAHAAELPALLALLLLLRFRRVTRL